MLRAFALVAVLVMSAGCILCPDCGCYPASHSGQWYQPELAEWARENLGAQPVGGGCTFDLAAAGLPADSSLAQVSWVFGQTAYSDQKITLYSEGNGVGFRYYYPADHDASDGAPKKDVLLAAVADLLDAAWAGNASGRQNVIAVFEASWVEPNGHGAATTRAPSGTLPDTWDWDTPFAQNSWQWPRPPGVGHQVAESGELRYRFYHATWAIEPSEGRLYEFIQVDGAGWAMGGEVAGREANKNAIQDDIRDLLAQSGAPDPTFDRFEPIAQTICVD